MARYSLNPTDLSALGMEGRQPILTVIGSTGGERPWNGHFGVTTLNEREFIPVGGLRCSQNEQSHYFKCRSVGVEPRLLNKSTSGKRATTPSEIFSRWGGLSRTKDSYDNWKNVLNFRK